MLLRVWKKYLNYNFDSLNIEGRSCMWRNPGRGYRVQEGLADKDKEERALVRSFLSKHCIRAQAVTPPLTHACCANHKRKNSHGGGGKGGGAGLGGAGCGNGGEGGKGFAAS
eukprot:872011-Pelagomonas_calceolata.AAC.1